MIKVGRVVRVRERAADSADQLEQGYTTICFKPSMFIDDASKIGTFCRRLVAKVEALGDPAPDTMSA